MTPARPGAGTGYAYGAETGAPAYADQGLANHIVSTTLPFGSRPGFEVIRSAPEARVAELEDQPGRSIYLCGGAQLAGLLLDAGLVDRLLLEVDPFVMGTGIPLCGGGDRVVPTTGTAVRTYTNAALLIDQRISGPSTAGGTP